MRRFVIPVWIFLAGIAPGEAQDVNACIDRCFSTFHPETGGSRELNNECLAQCKGPSTLYGAIAYGAKSIANGYGFDKPRAADAQATALVNCRQHGDDCKIVANFSDSCAAVAAVEAKGRFSTGGGRTRTEAQNNAMKTCQAQVGGKCEIEVWTCAGSP